MDLQAQIQTLIREAPQDGQTPQAVLKISPALLQVAQTLKFPQYYILQTLQQNWQITTLQHRQDPSQQKTVIYAYAQLVDATQASKTVGLVAVAVPVIQLLFQLLALDAVDSIIFQEQSHQPQNGVEVPRQGLQRLVQQQIQPPPYLA
ncbi:hypothetical protein GS597_14795 [Synechococcales cyanobacterium C]|uniref:Uncharacterized protein n=1 Tax=Petrachloros mirabilis ULC683 TaxID=2781853 RepID=A0A8K1ZYZ7_9CYAN|nr:hypothetical protein [Petrachloros mirabilis]NCJ07754.1 hypothetical protein [Petrachloros mirabilis ULC683]